jgi:hypothetical protein
MVLPTVTRLFREFFAGQKINSHSFVRGAVHGPISSHAIAGSSGTPKTCDRFRSGWEFDCIAPLNDILNFFALVNLVKHL